MRKTIFYLMLIFTISQLSYAGDNILVTDAWVREVPPGATVSAAYMTLQNKTNHTDKLTSISTDAADVVELHISKVDDNGVATMERVQVLELPSGDTVELKPGGMHLMLIGLKESLVGKESVMLELDFEKSGTLKIDVPVKSSKKSDDSHHHHHHH